MSDRVHPPVRIEVASGVTGQREAQARLQAHIITLHVRQPHIVTQRHDPVFRERFTYGIALVAPWIVEILVVPGLVLQERARGPVFLAVGRVGEGLVTLNLACRANLFAVVQAAQAKNRLVPTAVGVVQDGMGVQGLIVPVKAFVFLVGSDGAMADQPQ